MGRDDVDAASFSGDATGGGTVHVERGLGSGTHLQSGFSSGFPSGNAGASGFHVHFSMSMKSKLASEAETPIAKGKALNSPLHAGEFLRTPS